MNYDALPLIKSTVAFTQETCHLYYKSKLKYLNASKVQLLQDLHRGEFRLSGTNYVMPNFLISSNARHNLIHPLTFLIMHADNQYYTTRSGLDAYELRFTLEGKGYLEYEQKSYTLSEGEGFFIDCRKPHHYKTLGNQWVSTIFHFDGFMAENIFSQFSADNNVRISKQMVPNFEMLQFQILKASQIPTPYLEYKLSCLFDILLTEILTAKSTYLLSKHQNSLMAEIVFYMQENFNKDITLSFLCHKFGISRAKLCKEFKKYTGFSLKQYQVCLRMNKAKNLLAASSVSLDDICEEIGFRDTSHFIQTFKKAEGVTPLQYRKKYF